MGVRGCGNIKGRHEGIGSGKRTVLYPGFD